MYCLQVIVLLIDYKLNLNEKDNSYFNEER